MVDDGYGVGRAELIARLRADLGHRDPSGAGEDVPTQSTDADGDAMAGGSTSDPTVAVSGPALEIADRILAAATASVPR